MSPRVNSMNVYVRWRPLAESPTSGELIRNTSEGSPPLSVSVSTDSSAWTSQPAFDAVLGPDDDNSHAFATIVAPTLPEVLQGGSCSFFAYGHSGSGKTHTIIGYDHEHDHDPGLCLAAARQLFQEIHLLNEKDTAQQLGIGFSLFELRKDSAFDLLNNRTRCHIRQGPDDKVHIRGPTETLEGGKVKVQPIAKRPCWAFDSLRQELVRALGQRSVGSSSVHDQSSRTHAVLELEIISESLVQARDALVERQSELVPVGKRATDISIEEQSRGVVRTPAGGWAPNPDYRIDQARIDAAEAEKAEFEARVAAAEEHVAAILSSPDSPALGGKMAFVDLAGAEYHHEKTTNQSQQPQIPKQTSQERQEGRQINTDLLALKEVIRAWSSGQARVPFRSSPLTMVLREHFLSSEGGGSGSRAAMIVTVSPAREQHAATLNSLKYGSLVGGCWKVREIRCDKR